MLTYENPKIISKNEAEIIFSLKNEKDICNALISIALYEEDYKWTNDQLIKHLSEPIFNINYASIVGLSHLSRRYPEIDVNKIKKAFNEMSNKKDLESVMEDTLDDIFIFVTSKSK